MRFIRNLLFVIVAIPLVPMSYCLAYLLSLQSHVGFNKAWLLLSGGPLFPMIYAGIIIYLFKIATSKYFAYKFCSIINIVCAIIFYTLLIVDDNVNTPFVEAYSSAYGLESLLIPIFHIIWVGLPFVLTLWGISEGKESR